MGRERDTKPRNGCKVRMGREGSRSLARSSQRWAGRFSGDDGSFTGKANQIWHKHFQPAKSLRFKGDLR